MGWRFLEVDRARDMVVYVSGCSLLLMGLPGTHLDWVELRAMFPLRAATC